MIVLDTNVVSTLMRDPPEPAVLRWLDGCPRGSIWTTSITILEIRFGLAIMSDGRRRTALEVAFDRLVEDKLERRVAGFDVSAAQQTATLMGARQQRGVSRDIRDSMIAGIVLARRATLATRNVNHFADAIVDLVDPWSA